MTFLIILSQIKLTLTLTVHLTLTLQWSLIHREALEICNLSPFRSVPADPFASHFVAWLLCDLVYFVWFWCLWHTVAKQLECWADVWYGYGLSV